MGTSPTCSGRSTTVTDPLIGVATTIRPRAQYATFWVAWPGSSTASPRNWASRRSAGEVYTWVGVPTWARWPSIRTATWSAKESASAWSCVTRRAVAPRSARAVFVAARVAARRLVSSEENGSSSKTTCGSRASARARATRCCCPPDSWSGRRWARSGWRPTSSRRGPTALVWRRCRRGQAEEDVAGDVEVREERTVLADVADAPPLRSDLRGAVGQDPVADRDTPRGRSDETGDSPQEGGLPAAGRAQYCGRAAGCDRQADPLEHGQTAVSGGQVGDSDRVHRWSRICRLSSSVRGADSRIMIAAYGAEAT